MQACASGRHVFFCISPCEQSIGSAAGAAEVSTPPSDPRLKFAAAVLPLFLANLQRRLSPHPSSAEEEIEFFNFNTQKQHVVERGDAVDISQENSV